MKVKDHDAGAGVLFCSGMIAGEGLVGILLAILAVVNVADKMDFSATMNTGTIGGIILLILMMVAVIKVAYSKNKKKVSDKNE